jgi:hypothetical protein
LKLADETRMADFSIPLQGMSWASADFDRAASHIARSSVPTPKAEAPHDTVELSTSMVNLLQAKNDYAANNQAFRVADEINRNVLDMTG